ncbi:MAG: hypothetical protein HP002_05210 [Lentisphaeria bacterium]|nr:hypothetical protein [Lentisphaeria bacterium]
MKKAWLSVLAAILCVPVWAAHQYELNFGGRGENGSISVLENLESLSLQVSFKSAGGAGLGYYTYRDEPSKNTPGDRLFGKQDGGTIDLGPFAAGDNIGFFLKRKNGSIVSDFSFLEKDGVLYLTFDKNGGSGGDEFVQIGSITATPFAPAPSGQPLPGVVAALAVGGMAVAAGRWRRRKA